MINRSIVRRLLLGAATGLALAVTGVSVPIVAGSFTPAMAQTSEDMTAALEAYGHWVRHASYGEVWVPDGVPPDWQPYEYGHWVFTDEWGWYWVSDESEDDWGWVVYHYGRWAFDPAIGWFWVQGDEWAPAWVDWRYGGDNVGWAPLPPDDLVDAYDERPDYWVYVPLRYIGEPRLRSHFLPRDRRMVMLRETRLINRPVRVEGRRLWVNPGLAPGFIAGRTHVALHAYQVRPRVFGATTSVQGAVTVRHAGSAHQGCGQERSADNRAARQHADPGGHHDDRAEGARQGRTRTTRQPSAARRAGRRRSAAAAATATATSRQGPIGTPRTGPPAGVGGAPAGAGGPPTGAGGPPPHPAGPAPQPQVVHPVSPPPPPPPPPAAVHTPPPPVVHAPSPPPPPAVSRRLRRSCTHRRRLCMHLRRQSCTRHRRHRLQPCARRLRQRRSRRLLLRNRATSRLRCRNSAL